MRSSVWTTAAAIAVGLAIGYNTVRGGKEEDPYEHYLGHGKLHKSSIERVEIAVGDRVTVLQNRSPVAKNALHGEPLLSDKIDLSHWLLNGRRVELSGERVNALLSAIVGLRFEVEIPPELVQPDLSLYGLNTPSATLSIFDLGDHEVMQFGKKHAGGRKRYASVSGHPGVVIVPEEFFERVTVAEEEFAASPEAYAAGR